MKKIYFALITAVFVSVPALASPEDCLRFAGYYAAFSGGAVTSPRTLSISFDAATNTLVLQYGDLGDSRFRRERYIANGVEQAGDGGWTSNKYVATCEPNAISILKDYAPTNPNLVFTTRLFVEDGVLNQFEVSKTGRLTVRGQYRRQ